MKDLRRETFREMERRGQRIADAIEAIPESELPKNGDTAAAVLMVGVMLLKLAGHTKKEIAVAAAGLFDVVEAGEKQ